MGKVCELTLKGVFQCTGSVGEMRQALGLDSPLGTVDPVATTLSRLSLAPGPYTVLNLDSPYPATPCLSWCSASPDHTPANGATILPHVTNSHLVA